MEQIQKELQEIRKLLQKKKLEFDLVFQTTDTSINVQFPKPLNLNENSRIGFKFLSTYYNIPNIKETNNIFKYTFDGDAARELQLETGSYEIQNIADKISDFQHNFFAYNVEGNNNAIVKHKTQVIELKPDTSTMKCVMTIPENISVDFTHENSIGSILGFSKNVLSSGVHVSDLPVDINPVNTIMIHCNVVSGAIHNGKPSRSIYQFAPKVAPGYKMIEEARQITYYNIPHDEINSIQVWLTDQDGNILNNRKERITIVLHMIL